MEVGCCAGGWSEVQVHCEHDGLIVQFTSITSENKRYMAGLPISGVFVVACLPRIGLTLDTFIESLSLGDGRSL